MSKLEFIHQLYQIQAIRFGNFKLKSGQHSPIYLDLRQIISYPKLLTATADLLWSSLGDYEINLQHVCGVPYTALPIATCLSIKHNLPMLIRRKEIKNYGTKKIIEGVFEPFENCLIIEDVITTGSSVLETASELANVGLNVTDALVLIDREQGGKDILEKSGIKVHAAFNLTEILKILIKYNKTSDSDKIIIAELEAEII